MQKVTRRDLVATISSLLAVSATPGLAAVCDVTKSGSGQLARKTYSCRIGASKHLTATFMRLSDLVLDSLGKRNLPDGFDAIMDSHRLIDTPALAVFSDLFERFSYPITKENLALRLDGRQANGQSFRSTSFDSVRRMRTLGAWDIWAHEPLPIFPLPSELQHAIASPSDTHSTRGFLRFARDSDFDDLEGKLARYMRLWSDNEARNEDGPDIVQHLGNLNLMQHIRAGSVDGFLPLFFSDFFVDGCSNSPHGGAHFAPPGLLVDVAHCKNTGSEAIEIEDFFGGEDKTPSLRAYASSPPSGVKTLGLQPTRLEPGESAMMIQRLIFSADIAQREWDKADRVKSQRAVFGPTHLPKGVIVDGQAYPFEGRSHNAVILASYSDGASCPFLYVWCARAQEWVKAGKVLVGHSSQDQEAVDIRRLPEFPTRIKLVEREHERSFVTGLHLSVDIADGQTRDVFPVEQAVAPTGESPVILDVGQSVILSFEPPQGIALGDIVDTRLVVRGYYEKYTARHVAQRRQALAQRVPQARPVAGV